MVRDVKGMESSRFQSARHQTILPFTRYLAGGAVTQRWSSTSGAAPT
jgi:hypothetical protein